MSYKLQKQYRLSNHDYSSDGYYFVTICIKDRQHFFGKIKGTCNGVIVPKMNLSEIGRIAMKYWSDIPNRFSCVKLDEFVIMPNHLHGIIEIVNQENNDKNTPRRRNAPRRVRTFGALERNSLSSIINHYKGAVKKWCNKNGHGGFSWQPKFRDSVIRGDKSLYKIVKYIKDNPRNWERDRNNQEDLYM